MSSYGFVTFRLVSRRASETYGLLILPGAEAMPRTQLKGEHKGSWEKALEPSSGELCQPKATRVPVIYSLETFLVKRDAGHVLYQARESNPRHLNRPHICVSSLLF